MYAAEGLALLQPGAFNYFERNPERVSQWLAVATG